MRIFKWLHSTRLKIHLSHKKLLKIWYTVSNGRKLIHVLLTPVLNMDEISALRGLNYNEPIWTWWWESFIPYVVLVCCMSFSRVSVLHWLFKKSRPNFTLVSDLSNGNLPDVLLFG
jgi:hypothetical protein